jgi:benzodiazapine receptor
MKKKLKASAKLILSIILCVVLGSVGSLFTIPAIPTWYAGLAKPAFNPPNWLFGPVWTTLFILMGISLYLVLEKGWKKKGVKHAVIIFFIQFSLNILWSLLFFGLRSIWLGLVDIIMLWALITLTIKRFYGISKTAAYLLAPYILWVTFASVLNLFIFLLNR